MLLTTKLDVELAQDPGQQDPEQGTFLYRMDVVQGDTDTHAVELTMYERGEVWDVPEGAAPLVGYCKADGSGGTYDTLSDGTAACSVNGNVVTVVLAAQMLTSPGPVLMSVALVSGDQRLHVFEMLVNVRRNPSGDVVTEEDYVNMQQWLASLAPEIAQEMGTGTNTVMSQKAVTDAIASTLQHAPEFVNSLEECTDTAKMYVLPDGFIYAYMKKAGELFTNLADPDSGDWANDSRLNSSGSVVSYTGGCVSNWIEVTAGDVIYISGLNILNSTAGYIQPYTTAAAGVAKPASYAGRFTTDEDGVISYTIYTISSTVQAIITGIRFSGELTAAEAGDIIITKNEPITYGEGFSWQSTGRAYQAADYEDRIIALEETTAENSENIRSLTVRVDAMEVGNTAAQLPAYWQEYLPDKISVVAALQEAGGKDCFSFPLLTDIHVSLNLGKRSGLLAKAIMDQCHMRYALCLGDVVTRGANKTAESMEESFIAAEAMLLPIRDRLLQTQGNHDGSWGAEDLDGDGDVEGTEYYCHNFTPQKIYERIYRKVGQVGNVHFDASGTGYYIDDMAGKVRYILLNSHNNPYAENEGGTAVYNNMRMFRFGQSQFDLLAEALLTVPGEDWAVLSASHVPLNDDYESLFGGENGEHVLLRRLLAAYRRKAPFSGRFAGTHGDDAVSVEADFSEAKGQYIAHFAGHSHADTSGVYDGITVITTRCDGKEENDDTLNAEKVARTTMEQSFDVFTVNKATGMVYATKIGAGEDRVIEI